MLKRILSVATAGVLLGGQAFAQTPDKDAEYRDFEGANGKIIQAALLDKTDTSVTLLQKDGKRITVPLDKLSEADQEFVKSWTREKAIFIQKCNKLTIGQLLELRGYEAFTYKQRHNHIVMNGKVNGVTGQFLIDSGAGVSTLSVPFAEKAKCEVGPMIEGALGGVGGRQPAAEGKIQELSFGESTFKDIGVMVIDMDYKKPDDAPKSEDDGIFGSDLMKEVDAVISYPERKIFLRPDALAGDAKSKEVSAFRLFKTKDNELYRGKITSKTPTVITLALQDGKTLQVPITRLVDRDADYAKDWSEEGAFFLQYCQSLTIDELLQLRKYQSFLYKHEQGSPHIYVDGTMNDNPVRYMIDTGAETSCFNYESAQKFGCEFGPYEAQTVFGIGGPAKATDTLVQKLTMGDVVLTYRKESSVDMNKYPPKLPLEYIGLFGADFLRELDAVITYKEGRVFLLQRKTANAPAPLKGK